MSSNQSENVVEDRLFYFSKSADKVPGKGVNEKVKKLDEYSDLAQIKDWRKVLSNFSISPFVLENKKWLTVEHFYQGSKFSESFMSEFSLESKSKISELPELAKAAGGKSGKFKGNVLRPGHIQCDIVEFEKKKKEIMYKALFAKFSQNKDALKVLLNTNNAELWHGTRGVPPKRVYVLEAVRKDLKQPQVDNWMIKKIKIQLKNKGKPL